MKNQNNNLIKFYSISQEYFNFISTESKPYTDFIINFLNSHKIKKLTLDDSYQTTMNLLQYSTQFSINLLKAASELSSQERREGHLYFWIEDSGHFRRVRNWIQKHYRIIWNIRITGCIQEDNPCSFCQESLMLRCFEGLFLNAPPQDFSMTCFSCAHGFPWLRIPYSQGSFFPNPFEICLHKVGTHLNHMPWLGFAAHSSGGIC